MRVLHFQEFLFLMVVCSLHAWMPRHHRICTPIPTGERVREPCSDGALLVHRDYAYATDPSRPSLCLMVRRSTPFCDLPHTASNSLLCVCDLPSDPAKCTTQLLQPSMAQSPFAIPMKRRVAQDEPPGKLSLLHFPFSHHLCFVAFGGLVLRGTTCRQLFQHCHSSGAMCPTFLKTLS